METFSQFYEIREYEEFVDYFESDTLYEEILNESLRKKVDFVQELAKKTGTNIKDLFAIFKDTNVFKFMSYFGWSITKLFKFIREGFKQYHKVINILSSKIYKSKFGQKWDVVLKDVDDIIQSHPVLSKLTGVAVASILAYIWFNMTFTGSLEYDFNMTDMLAALAGKFTLVDIFSGEEGIKLLMLFLTGKMGLSFPWPGPSTVQFLVAVTATLAIVATVKLKNKEQLK